jgi:hypothetical protein
MKVKQWSEWFFASCAKHFGTKMNSLGIHYFVEGAERQTEVQTSFVEFRFDGPRIQEVSRDYFRLTIEINLLVSTVKGSGESAYKHNSVVGHVENAFTKINIYKLGIPTDIANDGSFVGCLDLRDDIKEAVVVNNMGKVRPDTRLIQSTVEGHYRMFLGGS